MTGVSLWLLIMLFALHINFKDSSDLSMNHNSEKYSVYKVGILEVCDAKMGRYVSLRNGP